MFDAYDWKRAICWRTQILQLVSSERRHRRYLSLCTVSEGSDRRQYIRLLLRQASSIALKIRIRICRIGGSRACYLDNATAEENMAG
ncbi:hypothetical protein PHYPO_G00153670 [Pangasianodon hypophthalmus]|uniref:Uncharacterized protein n=1 Tax=Pangasianodon hypophthalmus TaxID=310915 RepID=A0A5N5JY21_PANHP|nr:hypothetical protein PHYPO_G00153670 [Pangasianodon hypophthalmus]